MHPYAMQIHAVRTCGCALYPPPLPQWHPPQIHGSGALGACAEGPYFKEREGGGRVTRLRSSAPSCSTRRGG